MPLDFRNERRAQAQSRIEQTLSEDLRRQRDLLARLDERMRSAGAALETLPGSFGGSAWRMARS